MNDPRHPDPTQAASDGEHQDALLTAHALGQLDGAERAEVERRLVDDSESAARAHVDETRRLATALREVRLDEMPPRSPDLRRAVLAAAANRGRGEVGPVTTAGHRDRFTRWLLAGGGIAAAIAVIVGLNASRWDATNLHEVAIRDDGAVAGGAAPAGDGDQSRLGAEKRMETPHAPAASPALPGRPGQDSEPQPGRKIVADEAIPGSAPLAAKMRSAVDADGIAAGPAAETGGRASGDAPGRAAAREAGESLARRNEVAAAAPPKPVNDRQRSFGQRPVGGATPTPGAAAPTSRAAPHPFGNAVTELERSSSLADKEQPMRSARDASGVDRLAELSVERAKDAAPAPLGRESGPASGERYEGLPENRFQAVREQPLSTLSIDVDTGSYANVRRFLASGRLPPPEAVRLEELINYFAYDYPQPDGDRPFSVTLEAAACPWRPGHRLVRIGLEGRDVDRRERPAGNLVFLVDVSGSMSDADKLPLVKQSLSMLVEELTEDDRVAIVTYAGQAGLALPSTSGDQKQRIRAAIEALAAGGSTHGSAGIALAYEQAAANFVRGGANRVILATDGDLNVGVTSDEALVDLITEKARGGTFLTVLGFGTGNLQDTKMEKIADHGNGIYAYIDGVREARKVLVEQLTGSTITIAKDVKIQVEFNPAQVASYRLLGYENRMLAAQDFRDDRKDAGEIGAGHRVTALYEVELVGEGGAGGAGAEPLKYQPRPEPAAAVPSPVDAATGRELLTVKLRWKRPDGDTSQLDEVPLSDRGGAFETASGDLRFAAAVAGFGMILRGSAHKGDATLPLVARIAGSALGRDVGGYRAEFLDLVRRAESLRDGGQSPR